MLPVAVTAVKSTSFAEKAETEKQGTGSPSVFQEICSKIELFSFKRGTYICFSDFNCCMDF